MFSKLKHRLDRKSKRVVALLATAILLCGFTGCERSTIPDGSEISYSETGFDIERIRKNVIVDGQAIEIPIKLKELPKDWTYETSANRFAETTKSPKRVTVGFLMLLLRMTNVRLTA